MPKLTFVLTNPQFIVSTSEDDGEQWELLFKTTILRPDDEPSRREFTIVCDGKRFDGYAVGVEQTCFTYQKTPPETKESASPTSSVPDTNFIHLLYVPAEKQSPEDEQIYGKVETVGPLLSIHLTLSNDTFLYLFHTNFEGRVIYLTVGTDLNKSLDGEGLEFGEDPDGYDLKWRTARKRTTSIDTMELSITEPLPPDTPEEREAAIPSSIMPQEDSLYQLKLIQSINRLFWAVVVIGLIIILLVLR